MRYFSVFFVDDWSHQKWIGVSAITNMMVGLEEFHQELAWVHNFGIYCSQLEMDIEPTMKHGGVNEWMMKLIWAHVAIIIGIH